MNNLKGHKITWHVWHYKGIPPWIFIAQGPAGGPGRKRFLPCLVANKLWEILQEFIFSERGKERVVLLVKKDTSVMLLWIRFLKILRAEYLVLIMVLKALLYNLEHSIWVSLLFIFLWNFTIKNRLITHILGTCIDAQIVCIGLMQACA